MAPPELRREDTVQGKCHLTHYIINTRIHHTPRLIACCAHFDSYVCPRMPIYSGTSSHVLPCKRHVAVALSPIMHIRYLDI